VSGSTARRITQVTESAASGSFLRDLRITDVEDRAISRGLFDTSRRGHPNLELNQAA
jgi:hypothetical protein